MPSARVTWHLFAQAVMDMLGALPAHAAVLHADQALASQAAVIYGALLMMTGLETSAAAASSRLAQLLPPAGSGITLRLSVAGRRYLEYLEGLQAAMGPRGLSVSSLPIARPVQLTR